MLKDQTLLCWHSNRAGTDVLVNAIKALKNRNIIVSHILLLKQEATALELTNLKENITVDEVIVGIKDPTNHKEIYDILVGLVLPKIQRIENLHINISPGTPAMHAVWLILHAGGRLPSEATLWSSQKSPTTNRPRIDMVDFAINTYLSEIRTLQKSNNSCAMYDMEPKSPKRKEALDSLKRFSSLVGIPFLITGERGIGKTRIIETIVRTIKQKEMITLACGGLDSDVVDSLLFGHVKGAFTGAIENRDGLLKSANNAVLFLDEIQDLPKSVQRKLVRVLQDNERRYRPVGSDNELSVNFELICASNKSISELSEILDKDFFDRISMLTTRLPSLRECREDLLVDWQHVWAELRISENLPLEAPISDELEMFLSQSSLQGNLRDLQRMACLIMAYWQEKNYLQSISISLQEFEKLDTTNKNHINNNPTEFIEGLTRSDHINKFKQQLAINAKNQFGTWQKASEVLRCDERTLRKDSYWNNNVE